MKEKKSHPGYEFLNSDLVNVSLLVLVVGLIFGMRMSDRPLIGEESRYATAAREMIASGDWLVFRQQDQVFAERPPLTIWSVVAASLVRGKVDLVSVRLVSIISIVMTSLLLYCYVKSFASKFAAMTAGLVYPTMGQVLQIGRLGESEPLFALLLSSSLLLWHLGYLKKWPATLTWSIGFACAALAALAKGPQAPVYFVSIIGVYLLVRRDWRYLFSGSTAVGAAVFVAIIAAWQIPYYLATDWESVVATWTGLVKDRLRTEGLLAHMMKFPLETFGCLLPWSPILLAVIFRETRERLSDFSSVVTFLVVALVVSYPTVLLAVGARGRYYLPLYPCIAVLIAIFIDRCSSAQLGGHARRNWDNFLTGLGVVAGVAAIGCLAIGIIPNSWAESIHQPRWLLILFSIFSLLVAWICFRARKLGTPKFNFAAILAISSLFGFACLGLFINTNVARWNDPTSAVEQMKSSITNPEKIVSLGPIDHRFAYYYETQIEQIEWPTEQTPLPQDVEFFVFMRNPVDTPAKRVAGRGRTWYQTPGTVPFAWEELLSIDCNRVIRPDYEKKVVLGRVIRPLRAVVSDVTKPKAQRPDDSVEQ